MYIHAFKLEMSIAKYWLGSHETDKFPNLDLLQNNLEEFFDLKYMHIHSENVNDVLPIFGIPCILGLFRD